MKPKNETTVKISRWLIKEVELFIEKNNKNKSEFPSKKNFVDKAVIQMLQNQGMKI